MAGMKAVTIKVSDSARRRLQQEARATGRSVAAVVRDRLEVPAERDATSVHAVTADLAGRLAGRRRSATNARRRFGRS